MKKIRVEGSPSQSIKRKFKMVRPTIKFYLDCHAAVIA
jgi:hypothetical protein